MKLQNRICRVPLALSIINYYHHLFCEIVCPLNTYGQKCQQCGHCENPQCDWASETGACFSGCTAGYKGDNCQSGILIKHSNNPTLVYATGVLQKEFIFNLVL